MTQFRVMLEGGAVLVVTMEVEEAEAVESDPATIGAALLNALGIGRPVAAPKVKKMTKPKLTPAPEEDADAWLARTSKDALSSMKGGRRG